MDTHTNGLMHASIIGEGKSNVILKLNENYPGKVIRLCKRFPKVSSNNEYLSKNKAFQSRFNSEFTDISDHIANAVYTEVDKNTDSELFLIIQEVLEERFKMNLFEYKKCIDYPTIDQRDKLIPFCRNCSHIIDTKPQTYCYNGCKGSGGIMLFKNFLTYLNGPNNIVQKVYQLQKQLVQIIAEDEDIDMFYINVLIALRDISIFYNTKTEEEYIIDLDYKDITSAEVYHQKMQKEWGYLD